MAWSLGEKKFMGGGGGPFDIVSLIFKIVGGGGGHVPCPPGFAPMVKGTVVDPICRYP